MTPQLIPPYHPTLPYLIAGCICPLQLLFPTQFAAIAVPLGSMPNLAALVLYETPSVEVGPSTNPTSKHQPPSTCWCSII